MKIGLIGYGYWGKYVARAIARAGELSVIVDQDPQALMQAFETWGPWGTRVTSEAKVAHEECDAVWIATPNRTHFEDVSAALSAGQHVLCEKPFVTDVELALSLTEFAKSEDQVLMVGHLQLYTEAHRLARRKCTSGQQSKLRITRKNTQPSLSDGSVLWGIGPHDVAAIIDLFGPEYEIKRGFGTQHYVSAELRFPGKIDVSLELDWLAEKKERMFVLGTEDLATAPNKVEPLLAEAFQFVRLCQGANPGRADTLRQEAVDVTSCLGELEAIMQETTTEEVLS